jgi:hypothetical protein
MLVSYSTAGQAVEIRNAPLVPSDGEKLLPVVYQDAWIAATSGESKSVVTNS